MYLTALIFVAYEQSGKCRGCVLFFHFSKSFFRGFAYISNPFKQRLDGFADGCHQTVGRFDVTVEITDIGFNAFAFHSRDSGSHVDCRDNINPFCGICFLNAGNKKTVCLDENHFNQNKLFFIFTLILFYENN